MSAAPCVSIIVPVFNSQRYLKECLDSIIKQTFTDFEIIIIDDCSSDQSYELCSRFRDIDDRIRLFRNQENKGVSYVRNKAIRMAKGDFILFMDADDFYPSDRAIEILYSSAISSGLDIVGGSLMIVNALSDVVNSKPSALCFDKSKIISYDSYQHDGGFYRFIYKREFLLQKQVYFPYLVRFQDAIFLVRSLSKVRKFLVIPECVYAYRKGHKVVYWSKVTLISHIAGVMHVLNISSNKGYARLHSLMLKNATRSMILKTENLSLMQKCYLVTRIFGKVDLRLCQKSLTNFTIAGYCIKLFLSPFLFYVFKYFMKK